MYDEVSGPGSRFKEKHSLDSDEEDEEDDGGDKGSKYNILDTDDVEGKRRPDKHSCRSACDVK